MMAPLSHPYTLHHFASRFLRKIEIDNSEIQGPGAASSSRDRKSVLEAADLGYWTWDIARDFLVGDRRIAFLFGIDEKVAANGTTAENYIEHVEPEDQQIIRSELTKVLSTGGVYALEYRLRGADDVVRWVASHGRAILDSDPHAKSLNGVVQDITD
jgi:PAS domain-containing protein